MVQKQGSPFSLFETPETAFKQLPLFGVNERLQGIRIIRWQVNLRSARLHAALLIYHKADCDGQPRLQPARQPARHLLWSWPGRPEVKPEGFGGMRVLKRPADRFLCRGLLVIGTEAAGFRRQPPDDRLQQHILLDLYRFGHWFPRGGTSISERAGYLK
ncbi:MAG: hypothetical protein SFV51_13310 [Bryobacteraceae bacterium]|nr:hypothetical protein [Bryobacteraceae bacterium]